MVEDDGLPEADYPDAIPTKERLAREIDALARAMQDEGLRPMENRARQGYYDDYESPLATPIAELVKDFRFLGYEGMARKAMDGRWDGSTEEGEAWAIRQTDPEILTALHMMKEIT